MPGTQLSEVCNGFYRPTIRALLNEYKVPQGEVSLSASQIGHRHQ